MWCQDMLRSACLFQGSKGEYELSKQWKNDIFVVDDPKYFWWDKNIKRGSRTKIFSKL